MRNAEGSEKSPEEIQQMRKEGLIESEDYEINVGSALYREHCKKVGLP